jgi:hypothetical protein
MTTTNKDLETEVVAWLLEEADPGPRYLAMRDLVTSEPADSEFLQAQARAHEGGPISNILSEMDPEGFWAKPGPGYNPKYRSTVWSLIFLSQLGAKAEHDEKIQLSCAYLLDHALTQHGQFSASGTPSGTVDCLQGNLCAALLDLGYEDNRLDLAFDWMARTVTGDGIAPLSQKDATKRYYAGKCGPLFRCGSNNKLACAWGATKVMLAFSKLPASPITPQIEAAIEAGAEFLLAGEPAKAGYPNGFAEKPSGNWWKFGFPVFYVTDILQVVEALVGLGYGDDPRLADAVDLIRQKGGTEQRWPLEYSYAGKTWVDIGEKKEPNKWVTIRALKTLSAVPASVQ